MAIRDGEQNAPLYRAAERFVGAALRTQDSLFTPGTAIWSDANLRDLRERFVDRPDEGDSGFWEKFADQLAGAPAQTIQLAGELVYVHELPASTFTPKAKRTHVAEVLDYAESPVSVPAELDAAEDVRLAGCGLFLTVILHSEQAVATDLPDPLRRERPRRAGRGQGWGAACAGPGRVGVWSPPRIVSRGIADDL